MNSRGASRSCSRSFFLLLANPAELGDGKDADAVQIHTERSGNRYSSGGWMNAEMDVLDVLVDDIHRHFTELDLLRRHQYSDCAKMTSNRGVFFPGVFVADVFQEQEDDHVVLVLGGIHAAPEFVAGLPEGGVEFGFFEGHGGEKKYWVWRRIPVGRLICCPLGWGWKK